MNCPEFLQKLPTGDRTVLISARLLLLALLLKLNWGIWENWEWAMGDSAHHYAGGAGVRGEWWSLPMAWAPLYLCYQGIVGAFFENPYLASLVHRIVVVFAVGFLQFEVFRRFVPVTTAWFLTVWWLAIDANLAPLYTVHLFAHGSNLVCLLALAMSRTTRQQGWALALLALSAVFVRSETIAAWAFTTVVLFAANGFRWGGRDRGTPPIRLLRHYLVPMVVATLVTLVAGVFSDQGVTGSFVALREKAKFNFSQNYSFTYKQRFPEREGNVWFIYEEVCREDFGIDRVSVTEALRLNPGAFLGHVSMNLSNLPSAIQLGLFDARSGERNPDVVPTRRAPRRAMLLSIVALTLLCFGFRALSRDRPTFLGGSFRERFAGWVCYLGFFFQMIVVALVILPRSSFLLTGMSFLFLLAGLCLVGLWRQLPAALRRSDLFPVAGLILVLAIPSHWANRPRPYDAPRALNAALGAEIRRDLRKEGGKIAAAVYQTEVAMFFGRQVEVGGMETLEPLLAEGGSLGGKLIDRGFAYFFASGELVESHPVYREFAADPASQGWSVAGEGITGPVRWKLYVARAPGNREEATRSGQR